MSESPDYKPQICSEAINYCREVLGESEEKRVSCLKDLRSWLEENKHLNAKCDSFNLIRFLRATKYDLEKAKMKIQCFYTLRGTDPEWFENRDPFLAEIQEFLRIGVFLPLLERNDQGQMVILIRIAAHNPYLHKQDDFFKTSMMILDLALEKMEDTSVYGVLALFDMNGVTYAHARQLTTPMIRKAVHSWQDCYPVRVKGLNFFNSPVYINIVLRVFRRFMREKMRKRLHVHGYDQKSLHSIVPKRILPEEYGGSAGKLQELIDYWRREVFNARDWFVEDEKFKYSREKGLLKM